MINSEINSESIDRVGDGRRNKEPKFRLSYIKDLMLGINLIRGLLIAALFVVSVKDCDGDGIPNLADSQFLKADMNLNGVSDGQDDSNQNGIQDMEESFSRLLGYLNSAISNDETGSGGNAK
jgi:hypothetical protein